MEHLIFFKEKLHHQVFLVAEGIVLCGKPSIEDSELKSDSKKWFSEYEDILGILSVVYCAYILLLCIHSSVR